jgi:hypothetical protein
MMVWGCMGWNRVGMLTEVEKRMNAKQFVDIMDQHLSQSMEYLRVPWEKPIFQQGNDLNTPPNWLKCRIQVMD